MPESSTTYDDIPYECGAFWETHPDHLAVVARLHGLEPPPVETARVLEIACASGGNLIPMAAELPRARLVGIDLSRRQIEDGKALVERLGIGNVELHAMAVEDLGAQLGDFDYIIAHGLYSWVPAAVRDRVLSACAARLSTGGVAFVSYNVLPGWRSKLSLRDWMLYDLEGVEGPRERIARARALLGRVRADLPDDSAHAQTFRLEAERLEGRQDWYLYHEHLESINEPLYHHQFVEHAKTHGLTFLADARALAWPSAQPPSMSASLDRLAGADPARREQHLDFLLDRVFRRSLLVREGSRVGPPSSAGIAGLRIRAACRSSTPEPDVRSQQAVEFVPAEVGGALSTTDPTAKAALVTLEKAWPRSMSFDQVRAGVADRLGDCDEPRAARLAEILFACFLNGLVELQSREPPMAVEPGNFPRSSALARHQAAAGIAVTNLFHRELQPGDVDRFVLAMLDGTADREALLDRFVARLIESGATATRDGEAVTDPGELRSMLGPTLEESLGRLGRVGLLLADPGDDGGD